MHMIVALLLIAAYMALILALLWGNDRWGKELDRTAIPGLDSEPCKPTAAQSTKSSEPNTGSSL